MNTKDTFRQLLWEEEDLKKKLTKFKHVGVAAIVGELNHRGFFRHSLRDKIMKLESLLMRLKAKYAELKKPGVNPEKIYADTEDLENQIRGVKNDIILSFNELDETLLDAKHSLLTFLSTDNAVVSLIQPDILKNLHSIDPKELSELKSINYRLNVRLSSEIHDLFEILNSHYQKLKFDVEEDLIKQIAAANNHQSPDFSSLFKKIDNVLSSIDNILRDAERLGQSQRFDEQDNKKLLVITTKILRKEFVTA